ncbi:hypothetical protein SPRG_03122 [Saprolegnia parasitica CBS 223.65]|uniref:Uncharacterized protein n=1 Tax=Saprolegnia parasitica (strain CBS 223.65) TaxID=695850 RepID=A0A067CZF6_SAPPC|nr:hypothetical protein SPRG_03122 [Saprolegnia parasitica CBS 223.65]KDO31906.1 hypothetical protein SPRG_03122 [Saprolegnia parasitica CBS 223.65]|eukprot:XP_012197105.1 hypothetical protein SPRG_03122 [Saprolegnia parasitica CBS 223.65]
MLVMVLSPAKTLDLALPKLRTCTQPKFLEEASILVQDLRKLTPAKLKGLLGVSDALAKLNHDRYKHFVDHADVTSPADTFKQALFAFDGPAYKGIQADSFSDDDIAYVQDHLRILCGLYGILRPLDLIQPYRLEMGQKFANARGKDLYTFWGTTIASELNDLFAAADTKILLNVASQEYFKSVDTTALDPSIEIVDVVFKDDGKIKSAFAKRARGLMVHYVATHRVTSIDALQAFNLEGYAYSAAESTASSLVFLRSKTALKRHQDATAPPKAKRVKQ